MSEERTKWNDPQAKGYAIGDPLRRVPSAGASTRAHRRTTSRTVPSAQLPAPPPAPQVFPSFLGPPSDRNDPIEAVVQDNPETAAVPDCDTPDPKTINESTTSQSTHPGGENCTAAGTLIELTRVADV